MREPLDQRGGRLGRFALDELNAGIANDEEIYGRIRHVLSAVLGQALDALTSDLAVVADDPRIEFQLIGI